MTPPDEARRRTRRGEGEVTQWPRGLVDYTPKDVPDDPPSADEDRTGNRIRLVARLLAVLTARGQDVDRELRDLSEAERAYRAGRHGEATRRVELLLARLGPEPDGPEPAPSPTR